MSKKAMLPADIEAFLQPRRFDGPEPLAKQVQEIYEQLARSRPHEVSAKEIRHLRKSQWAPFRASAILLWSRRRPQAFLKAAAGFFEDDKVVRIAVMEGLANAAILANRSPVEAHLGQLLATGKNDVDRDVRKASEETEALLRAYHASLDSPMEK